MLYFWNKLTLHLGYLVNCSWHFHQCLSLRILSHETNWDCLALASSWQRASSGSQPLQFWPGSFDANATNDMASRRLGGLEIWSAWERSYGSFLINLLNQRCSLEVHWHIAKVDLGKMGRFYPIVGMHFKTHNASFGRLNLHLPSILR